MVNVGSFDRILRVVVGSVLVVLGMQVSGFLMLALVLLGIALVISGLLGQCFLYSLFGTSTKKYKVEKISKRDIQRAVEQYKSEDSEGSSLNVAIQPNKKVETKKVTTRSAVSGKKTVKKVAKTGKKVAAKKKKSTPTKKAVKKTTKRAVKKN